MKIAWLLNLLGDCRWYGGRAIMEAVLPAFEKLGWQFDVYPTPFVYDYRTGFNKDKLDLDEYDLIGTCDYGIQGRHLPEDRTFIWSIDDPSLPTPDTGWKFLFSNSLYSVEHVYNNYKDTIVTYLPFAFDSFNHGFYIDIQKKKYDCIYVGNGTENKPYDLIIEPATEFYLVIYGNAWKKNSNYKYQHFVKGPVEYTTIPIKYALSKIALNMHRPLQRERYCSYIMKDFEILGIGQCPCISDYFEGWDALFKDMMIIVKTPQETRQAIENVLANPDKYSDMVERAKDFIRSEHTYRHRVETIIQTVLEADSNA